MKRKRPARSLLSRLFLLAVAAFVIAGGGIFVLVLRALPLEDGERAVAGIDAPVTISRDGLGIPVIRAESMNDAAYAQGFVHAQERYVQMDLARRFASGRLAELIGGSAVDLDMAQRRLGFERVAADVVENAPEARREMLSSYTDGVNEGLRAMRSRHPEYLLLRSTPEPWTEPDCVLVAMVMHRFLSIGDSTERMVNVMDDALPADLVSFLTPHITAHDAPLFADPDASLVPMPTSMPPAAIEKRASLDVGSPPELGSNNWAVGPSKTRKSRAIIANDMHLGLAVPNTWHRVEIRTPHTTLTGVALPGMPGIVQGSNTHIAWGFTNVTGDFMDLVQLRIDPEDDGAYLTTDGAEAFGTRLEIVHVRGGEDRELTVRTTRWGPVVDELHDGTTVALAWAALDARTFNLNILGLFNATTADAALDICASWMGPPQNCVVADAEGNIGWTLSGYLPRREGFIGKRSCDWSAAGVGWVDGEQAERPRTVNPASGFIATANGRMLEAPEAEQMGTNWGNPVRQARIQHLLREADELDERAMLAIQLDADVTMTFAPYAGVFADLDAPSGSALAKAKALVKEWNGLAATDQPAMTILEAYRRTLHDTLIRHLVSPCKDVEDGFRYRWFQSDEVTRRLLETRPEHLLPDGHDTWDAFLLATAVLVVDELDVAQKSDEALSWGNTRKPPIRHPLSSAIPGLGALLDAPRLGLDGHPRAVRAQAMGYGASQRTVVAPGREGDGLLHMPTGQVSNPLSPHSMDMHGAWVRGEPVPLLAGRPNSTLTLTPAKGR